MTDLDAVRRGASAVRELSRRDPDVLAYIGAVDAARGEAARLRATLEQIAADVRSENDEGYPMMARDALRGET